MTSMPMAQDPLITTARLVLAPFTADDAPFIVALLTDPDWLRYIGDRGVRTEEEARGYLAAGPLASYAAHGFGLYRVARRDTGVPIGMCGLLRRDTLPDVDLGFAFLPAYRGQGFAREAAAATLAYARGTLGLARILAIVSPENAASMRVLEALGMAQEGMVRLSAGADAVCLFASPPAVQPSTHHPLPITPNQ
jgi:ribosomal-protein-alanine N-acetyltransferase